jgi:hypothetical protein
MHTMWLVILVVWCHFISDFLFQTDKMAVSKSSSNYWLTKHVLVYSALFLVIFGPVYAIVNFALHWITDFLSSRATTKLWKMGPDYRHWFFAVIGLDQAVHMTCLFLTLPLRGW